jgi:hypothetical protein
MFKQPMIGTNIRRVFQEAGFELEVSACPYRIRIDEEQL